MLVTQLLSWDCEWDCENTGELGVDGGESDDNVDGDESAEGSSELVFTVMFSFERAIRRDLPGNARLTKLESRAVRLEVERVLP